MKQIFTLLCFLLAAVDLSAQDSTIALSKFETFSNRSGIPIRTESKNAGTLRSMRISHVRSTDLSSGSMLQAISISPSAFNNYTEPLIGVGNYYIDLDDTTQLFAALESFSAEIKRGNTSITDFTLSYTTSNDVRFYVTYNHNAISPWVLRIGQQYRHLRSMVPGSIVTLGRREIDELIYLLRLAAQPW